MHRYREIASYEELHKYAQRARSKPKGRPISSGWRVFAEDQEVDKPVYLIACQYYGKKGTHFLLHPDNILEVHTKGSNLGQSATYVLDKLFGIWVARYGTGRYAVFGPHQTFKWRGIKDEKVRHFVSGDKEYPDEGPYAKPGVAARAHAMTFYFDGVMKFKLHGTSIECLNPKGDPIGNVNDNARKRWLQDRRWFKQQFTILARLGVLDNPLKTVANPQSGHQWLRYAPWNDKFQHLRGEDAILEAMVATMKKREMNSDVMVAAAAHALIYTNSDGVIGDYNRLKVAMHKYLNNKSMQLRSMFGVFNEEEE